MTSPPASETAPNSAGALPMRPGVGVEQHVGTVAEGGKVVGVEVHIAAETAYDVRALPNPFLGLQSFTYADRAKYGGRSREVAAAVAKLTAPDSPQALLFVTGASGSGKSSFAQAGLLPALEQHYDRFAIRNAVFRPSANPLAGLSDALWRQLGLPALDLSAITPESFGALLGAQLPPLQINLIVVDQFEELFTQSAPAPRDTLLTLLAHLPPFMQARTHVIATMRADYLPELFAIPELYELAKQGLDLRAMSESELSEAIQQPLRVAYPDGGKRFEPELVARLARDAAENAAYLPLLQVTLEELWRKGSLTLERYGSLTDAIEQRADKVLAYEDYDEPAANRPRPVADQGLMLDLCVDLVDPSPDDNPKRDVRRRRTRDELAGGSAERARLIEVLTQARLFSTSTSTLEHETCVEVDIIHETLLTNWDRLRAAIAERRRQLRQRARLDQQLKDWLANNRGDDYLLAGVRLAEARELDQRDDVALRNADARLFLQRSLARAEAELQEKIQNAQRMAESQKRTVLLRRWVVAVLLIGIFASAGASVVAIQQRNAAEATLNNLYALERTAQYNFTILRGHTNAVVKALFDPYGHQILTVSEDGTARVWDNDISGTLISVHSGHSDRLRDAAFSPLAESVATASNDGTVRIRKADFISTDSLVGTFFAPPTTVLQANAGSVSSVAFGPYKRRSDEPCLTSCEDLAGTLVLTAHQDGGARIWDAKTGKLISVLRGPAGYVWSAKFNADGRLALTASSDGAARIWDTASGQPISEMRSRYGSRLNATFSPDEKYVATTGFGYHAEVWDAQTGRLLFEPQSRIAEFSPDSKLLVTAGEDNVVRIWDIGTARPLAELAGHTSEVEMARFSPNGLYVASASLDDTAHIWDARTGNSIAVLRGHKSGVTDVRFSPDGIYVVTAGGDGTARVWKPPLPN